MFKKIFSFSLVMMACLALAAVAMAANEKKTETSPIPVMTKTNPMAASQARPMARPMVPSMGMISGTITKINNSDPANSTLEVKSDKDNSLHTITVMPWTNITKITGLSELKTGDSVRVLSRKVNDKDTAMGVVFGDLKKITPPVMPKPVPGTKKSVPLSTVEKH
jgi:hypothetical protein